jgi:hypothetical protein
MFVVRATSAAGYPALAILIDRRLRRRRLTVLRRVIRQPVRRGHADHQPQRSVPQLRLDHLGVGIYTLPTPFSAKATRIASVAVAQASRSSPAAACAGSTLFTYESAAMQAPREPAHAYYMGIPVKLVFAIWAISGVATVAGVLLAPMSLIDVNIGFIGLKAFAAAVWAAGPSRALAGGLTIGVVELFSGTYLPGFKDVATCVVP